MASCKDCMHYDICSAEKTCLPDYVNCKYYKDRNRFIELPCKVGDTVYYLDTKYEKQGRRKVAIDIVEKGIVDSIILGQTMIAQIVVCNKDNAWTTFDSKSDFGKIVFLSPDQAEQVMRRVKTSE